MFSSITVSPLTYNSIYERKIKNNCLEKIDEEIIEDKKIVSVRCNGFLAKGDLDHYKELLIEYSPAQAATNEKIILDIGCGFGGLGRWLSRELNFSLIGIDFSEVAIKEARSSLVQSESDRVHFKVANFYETGLKRESIISAISLDSLYLATNPLKALKEINQVLQPNAPLIFTIYLEAPKRLRQKFNAEFIDWKTALQASGFTVVHYEDVTECWRMQMRKKHENRWYNKQKIRKELGTLAEAELSVTESILGLNGKPSFIETVSRFEIAAIKTRK